MTITQSTTYNPSNPPISGTQSATPSSSQDQTSPSTSSQSLTPTLPPTVSTTASMSLSQSPSASQQFTQSSTMTPSQIQTPSLSLSASLSAVYSNSQSATQSESNSPSASLTQTSTPSQANSPSQSSSPSATRSMSGTPTPSLSGTPSQSTSPEPFSLLFSAGIDARNTALPAVIMYLALADSLPPSPVRLWLDRCPGPADSALLGAAFIYCRVSTIGDGAFAAIGPAIAWDAARANVISSAASERSAALLDSPCDPESVGSLPVLLSATARFGGIFQGIAAPTTGTAECRVIASTGIPLALTTFPVNVAPTRWPLWDDIIFVSATGVLRSSRLGVAVNATRALLAANECKSDAASCLSSALSNSSLVISVAASLWTELPLPNVSTSSFVLTLAGASRIVIRGQPRSFEQPPLTSATLQGVPCNVSAVSSDGAWSVLDTPLSAALCGSAERDCGYATLALRSSPSAGALGATLSCPPVCPGSISGGVVPIATGDGTFALGSDPTKALG